MPEIKGPLKTGNDFRETQKSHISGAILEIKKSRYGEEKNATDLVSLAHQEEPLH